MKKRRPKKNDEEEGGGESSLKPEEETGGIKLAICVCMYSETKSMLKSTLAGIA